MSITAFWALVTLLFYGIILVIALQAIYAIFLAIKALKIYIKKNS